MDEILSYMNNGVLNLKSLKEVNLSRQSISLIEIIWKM